MCFICISTKASTTYAIDSTRSTININNKKVSSKSTADLLQVSYRTRRHLNKEEKGRSKDIGIIYRTKSSNDINKPTTRSQRQRSLQNGVLNELLKLATGTRNNVSRYDERKIDGEDNLIPFKEKAASFRIPKKNKKLVKQPADFTTQTSDQYGMHENLSVILLHSKISILRFQLEKDVKFF